MTPARLESLRAEFERACAALPPHERPSLDRRESGEYRTMQARERWAGWCMAVAEYCEGEA